MLSYWYVVGSVFISVIVLWPKVLWTILLCLIALAAIVFAISGTVTAHIMLSIKHTATHVTILSPFLNFHKYIFQSYNNHIQKPVKRLPVVFGRSVDVAFQDLLDLIIGDLISPWLADLALFSKELQFDIKKEIWYALSKLNERLVNIDKTRLIAVDMVSKVTSHFEKIRLAQAASGNDSPGQFYLSHHLLNSEKELNYLRKVSELILVSLFSKSLVNHICNKNLLIEILACKVLLPSITLLTDPDYINQKILEYIEQVVQMQNLHQNSCAHAESYQDFIHLIKSSNDVNHLKHVRYSIMTEIMQATTIQNLKKVKDVENEKDQISSKKLRKYLGQLKYAKLQCENQLRELGCPGFPVELDASVAIEKKILPFEKLLESPFGRKMLYQFLENGGQETLLAYWSAVEELRATEKKNWHQIGAEIYYTFIHSSVAPIKVEKSVRRRIESFLLGNSGPESFYEIQDNVVHLLKEKVYPNFILTDYYTQFLQHIETNYSDLSSDNQSLSVNKKDVSGLEQSGYAKSKLNQLQERLNNKSQALQALRLSLKPESKVLSGLEKEVEHLEGEKRQLEAHLTRTEAWEEHLGKWRAVVQTVETSEDKEPLQFVLVVHVFEDNKNSEAISTGWVVLRKLSEFYELHRKLIQVWNGVKQLELPSQSPKFLFGKQSDKSNLEKAKAQIQKYLEFILEHERLNTSEALYTFLSPSSEHLKISNAVGISSPKKNRFFLSTFFKSSNQQGNGESSRESDEEEFSLLDENEVKFCGGEGKDAIAEPLYALLGEIFDLHGVFRWLRKTLITFVQITYGRTISRQVGETVAWLFSEQMVHSYITTFIQSWWPNGTMTKQQEPRTKEEKQKTRADARNRFINNTPEVLNNLVGQQNARKGAIKIFEILQDVRLNKQLVYDLLELLIYELFPEIKRKGGALTSGKRKS